MAEPQTTLRVLISCPDRPGIVAAVSRFLLRAGREHRPLGPVLDRPVDGDVLPADGVHAPVRAAAPSWPSAFGLTVASRFDMTWRLWDSARPKRIAILVSRYDHCLQELLWRWRRGELDAEIVLVASNHPDLREAVERFGLPYHHVPVEKDRKAEAEAALLELLDGQLRPGRARPLHADPLRRLPRARGRADDQHPPLVPAGVRRRRALPAGQGSRRQADRGDRALRHRGARRRPDHRAGRDPRQPPRRRQDARHGWAPRSSDRCWRGPSSGTARTGSCRHGNTTVVF